MTPKVIRLSKERPVKMMVESGVGSGSGDAQIEQGPGLRQGHAAGGRPQYTFPMVRESDMAPDMQAEVMELCGMACDRHATNNENAAKAIKEQVIK